MQLNQQLLDSEATCAAADVNRAFVEAGLPTHGEEVTTGGLCLGWDFLAWTFEPKNWFVEANDSP